MLVGGQRDADARVLFRHREIAWTVAEVLGRRLQVDGLDLASWGAFRLADQSGKGYGEERWLADHLAAMARLEALLGANPPLAVKALALDGRALMALAGRKGGPGLGELQHFLLEKVLDEPAGNARGMLESWAREWLAGH